jgi:hypothetical protein
LSRLRTRANVGVELGTAFENIKGRLYPAVYFSPELLGASITANFSDKDFRYSNWRDEKNVDGELPRIALRKKPVLSSSSDSDS